MTRAIEIKEESCTELDSHANMPVVGKHAYIIAETSKMVDVSPFTPDYKPLTVPLVEATIKYNNPYNGKSCILVLRNALYVLSMDNNLIPPFMLREMGVAVNDIPKIHKEDPTVDDHALPVMATLLQVLAPLTHYSHDIYPIVNLKPRNKIMMTPLAMMMMIVLQ